MLAWRLAKEFWQCFECQIGFAKKPAQQLSFKVRWLGVDNLYSNLLSFKNLCSQGLVLIICFQETWFSMKWIQDGLVLITCIQKGSVLMNWFYNGLVLIMFMICIQNGLVLINCIQTAWLEFGSGNYEALIGFWCTRWVWFLRFTCFDLQDRCISCVWELLGAHLARSVAYRMVSQCYAQL
jgi:hypothetical protein